MTENQLADRIRAAMVASGLTRYQLSQQTGVAQAVLGRFAAGKRDLTLSTASRLVPALGLELATTKTKRRPKA
jgi:transcriptional regulator with XRE-family HTH domain